jgi:hypothetical protein
MRVFCADKANPESKSETSNDELSDEETRARRVELEFQIRGVEQELNSVHFNSKTEEDEYLEYLMERIDRDRKLNSGIETQRSKDQQEEKSETLKFILESIRPGMTQQVKRRRSVDQ